MGFVSVLNSSANSIKTTSNTIEMVECVRARNEFNYDESLAQFSGRIQIVVSWICLDLISTIFAHSLDSHTAAAAAAHKGKKVHSLEKRLNNQKKVIYRVMYTQIIQVTINTARQCQRFFFDDDASSSSSELCEWVSISAWVSRHLLLQ